MFLGEVILCYLGGSFLYAIYTRRKKEKGNKKQDFGRATAHIQPQGLTWDSQKHVS